MATKEKHDVWSYFPFINETTRKCSECSKTYEVPLYPSTAKSHIMSNHPEIWLRIRTRPGQYINNKKKKKRTKSNIIYSDISTTTSVTATPLVGPSPSSFVDLDPDDEDEEVDDELREDVPKVSNSSENSRSNDFKQKGLNDDKLSMKNIMIIETEDNSEVMIESSGKIKIRGRCKINFYND
ncbi:hypothetical protein F8M41_021881 [Gigaspora margarita]|uniref:BED-type domain-containing protein n=1 Tax=Gigaspora margarita TaxID=4874 RepID=A0A8H4AG48_GIGMA|nr:hypothetical protein F8M41_021881 [Gigaspora margarita]